MKIKNVILTIISLVMLIPVYGQKLESFDRIKDNGYNFWVYSPKADTTSDKPLIIFLHGASLCGRNLRNVLRYGPIDALRRGRKIDAFIIAPQNPGGSWSPKKVIDLVDWGLEHYRTNPNKVYVIGMSLGGYGTIDVAAAYPERFAAAMAICGGGTTKNYSRLHEIPLWILHGTADRDVPISASEGVLAQIKAQGHDDSRVKFTRLEGVNHGRPARIFYLKKTYDWLFSHDLTDEGRPMNMNMTISVNDLNNAYRDIRGKIGNEIPIMEGHAIKSSDNAPKPKGVRSENEPTPPKQPGNVILDNEEAGGEVYHTVVKGDNLYTLARKNKTTVKKLCELNNITESTVLSLGKRLRIK